MESTNGIFWISPSKFLKITRYFVLFDSLKCIFWFLSWWFCWWKFSVWLMSVWSAFIVSYVKRSIRSLNERFLGKWSVFTRASYFYFAHLLRLSLMHLWKLLHHFSITILFEVFYCLLMLPMHSLVQNSFNLDSNKVYYH